MERYRDLEDRTLEFTRRIVDLCNRIPRTPSSVEIVRQVVRSAGSVGANYREANEKLSKKDFILRIRIARKEAKETTYWLEVLKSAVPNFGVEMDPLIRESEELRNILSAILAKTLANNES